MQSTLSGHRDCPRGGLRQGDKGRPATQDPRVSKGQTGRRRHKPDPSGPNLAISAGLTRSPQGAGHSR